VIAIRRAPVMYRLTRSAEEQRDPARAPAESGKNEAGRETRYKQRLPKAVHNNQGEASDPESLR